MAIKSVNKAKLNKKLMDNLYLEIDILQQLKHPHIVALLGRTETSTHIHLIMEYCTLGDLSFFIRKRLRHGQNPVVADMAMKYPHPKEGGLHEVISRHFLKQIASALQFLRERDYIHRDLKPQNLLLLPSPNYMRDHPTEPLLMTSSTDSLIAAAGLSSLPMLKLADFGFARSLPSTSLAETLCGSPLYMAPEILRYEKYDGKADLWSVGTIMYEMVNGRPPFRATNHVELLRKIEQQADRLPWDANVAVSDNLRSVITGLLKKNPVERISFENFFAHPAVTEDIPGLAPEDRPKPTRSSPRVEAESMRRVPSLRETRRHISEQSARPSEGLTRNTSTRAARAFSSEVPDSRPRQSFGTPPRAHTERFERASDGGRGESLQTRRPVLPPAATAPNRNELHHGPERLPAALDMLRGRSQDSPSPGSSLMEKRKKASIMQQPMTREERLRALQDVADERDWEIVNKEKVVINALADQLEAYAAKGRIPRPGARSYSPEPKMRRAQTTGRDLPPSSMPDAKPRHKISNDSLTEKPRTSIGARLKTTIGRTRAIVAKHGGSLPAFMKGQTPQTYAVTPSSSPISNLNGFTLPKPTPKGTKFEAENVLAVAEESYFRAQQIYELAEVKYQQLVPHTPSMKDVQHPKDDTELTPEATIEVCQEAYALYIMSDQVLGPAHLILKWWLGDEDCPTRTSSYAAARSIRESLFFGVNDLFNELAEKRAFAMLKWKDGRRKLPVEHELYVEYEMADKEADEQIQEEVGVNGRGSSMAVEMVHGHATELGSQAADDLQVIEKDIEARLLQVIARDEVCPTGLRAQEMENLKQCADKFNTASCYMQTLVQNKPDNLDEDQKQQWAGLVTRKHPFPPSFLSLDDTDNQTVAEGYARGLDVLTKRVEEPEKYIMRRYNQLLARQAREEKETIGEGPALDAQRRMSPAQRRLSETLASAGRDAPR